MSECYVPVPLSHTQLLIAETVLQRALELCCAQPFKREHQVLAWRLRESAEAALEAFDQPRQVIQDDATFGVESVGAPFDPDLRALWQITTELTLHLRASTRDANVVVDNLEWLAHLGHMHLVEADLAAPDPVCSPDQPSATTPVPSACGPCPR